MTDLELALQEALQELDGMLAGLAEARAAGEAARNWAADAVQQLESGVAQLSKLTQSCQATLAGDQAKAVSAFDASHEQQVGAAQQVADMQRMLEREKLLTLEELEQWRLELEALEALLAERRGETGAQLEAASQRTLESLLELAGELDGLSNWTSGELTPRVRQEQDAVAQRSEALRAQVLDTTLPGVTLRYEEVQAHLLQLASELEQSLTQSSGQAYQKAQSALGELSKTMLQLCEQNAAELRAVSQLLDKEAAHIRSRCEELMRQAKTYLQFGTGAASHLGLVVGLITYTESLLVEAKVLEPAAEVV